jgi:hypothetical protein
MHKQLCPMIAAHAAAGISWLVAARVADAVRVYTD